MTREEARKKAEDLVRQMTLEEAASQLRYDAPAIERLGIPEYNWWNEALHGVARAGVATCFPQAIGLGATFDTELMLTIAKAIALETRAKYNTYSAHNDRTQYKGVTMWTPNINIFRDPRWGRGQETFGEDPLLTAQMGCAMINGLQEKRDGFMTAAACAKHFAVHSGPEALRHEFDAKVSKKDLWETYLPAFEACVKDAGVEAVMGAYNRTNGEPCCAHEYLMNDVLRGEWKFEGHYVSDCWAIRDFHEKHHITEAPEDSVSLALGAGCDLNCGCTYQRILNAYEQGKITREEIDRSAVRLFTTRYLLGLFDKSALDEIPYSVVGCREHLELAYRAAIESCVLLKNDGTLPLDKKNYHTIAVIGPNADSTAALVGNYNGTPPRAITLLQGISDFCFANNIEVHYAQGCHLYDNTPPKKPHLGYFVTEGVIAAEHSDLAILCVGLDAGLEGEQGDRGNQFPSGDKSDLLLPETQRTLIEAVAKTGTPFILVNASGSPIDLSAYEEQAKAILQVWYPGGEGGRAVADILFGNAAPQGKLPVTFYYNDNRLPEITDYAMKDRTYRYMTQKPWKPFGFGLTYGEAQIDSVQVDVVEGGKESCFVEKKERGWCVTIADKVFYQRAAENGVEISVSCSAKYDTCVSEVIQLYVHVKGTQNEVPNAKLAAFGRVQIAPDEKTVRRFFIPAKAFTTVNHNGERNADGNGADIYIGFYA